jgi:hypothetical protein
MVAAQKLLEPLQAKAEELKILVDRSTSARYEGHVPPKWVETANHALAEADQVIQGLQRTASGEAPFAAENKTVAQGTHKGLFLQTVRLRNLLAEASLARQDSRKCLPFGVCL